MTEYFFPNNKCDLEPVEKINFDFVLDCNIQTTPPPIFECLPEANINREPEIPCPNFAVKSGMTVGYQSAACVTSPFILFEIKRRINECEKVNECNFDIDFEIDIPIPIPPCPEITVTKFKVDSGFAGAKDCSGENKFVITSRRTAASCDSPGQCQFDVELEIFIPIPPIPCPILNVKNFDVKTEYESESCAQGENKFVITTKKTPGTCKNPERCEFDFELELVIPIPEPPCPELNVTKFNVNTSYETENCDRQTNRFVITSRKIPGNCRTPPKCLFDIELELDIPIPKPPCPEINVKTFSVVSSYADEGCGEAPNRFEIRTRHTPGDCNAPEQCAFDVDLEIFIPIPRPPCPDITVSKFDVKSGSRNCVSGQNRFVITKRYEPAACADQNEPGKCEFDIELEIYVPVPDPPCPTFNVKSFAVGGGSKNCLPPNSTGENKFLIISRHTPPTCDTPGKCEFDVELEIHVPIPTPPCPEINAGNFSVNYVVTDDPASLASCNNFSITSAVEEQCKIENNFAWTERKCTFDLQLDLCIPVPPCPEFTVKNVVIQTGYVDCLPAKENKFIISKPNPQKCNFEFELELYIPVPRPVCPIFDTALNVNTFFAGGACVPGLPAPPCPAGGGGGFIPAAVSSFSIIDASDPATSCDCDDGQQFCSFLFALDLNIPIPKLVQEIDIQFVQPDIQFFWCPPKTPWPPGPPLLPEIVVFNDGRLPDPWILCCDRGQKIQYRPELIINKYIPRWPCEYVKLTENVNFDVGEVTEPDFKFKITPKPAAKPCDPCEWRFDVDLHLPCQCKYVFKSHKGTDYEHTDDRLVGGAEANVWYGDDGETGDAWLEFYTLKECNGKIRLGDEESSVDIPDGGQEEWWEPAKEPCTEVIAVKPFIRLPKSSCSCPIFNDPVINQAYQSPGASTTSTSWTNIRFSDSCCGVRPGFPYQPPDGDPECLPPGGKPNPPRLEFKIVKKDPKSSECEFDIQADLYIPLEHKYQYILTQEYKKYNCRDSAPKVDDTVQELISQPTKTEKGDDNYFKMAVQSKWDGTQYIWLNFKHWIYEPLPLKFIDAEDTGDVHLKFYDTIKEAEEKSTFTLQLSQESVSCDVVSVKYGLDLGLVSPKFSDGYVYANTDAGGVIGSTSVRKNGNEYTVDVYLQTTDCPTSQAAFTAPKTTMEFTAAKTTRTASTGAFSTINNSADNLWHDPAFIDEFLQELKTNNKLRDGIRALLTE